MDSDTLTNSGVVMDTASNTGPFDLSSQRLAALPIVEHFLRRTGLPALLENSPSRQSGRPQKPMIIGNSG
jgi:hypothetical protein